MKKKVFVLAMSGVLAMGLMAGCGKNKEISSTETESVTS